MMSSTTNMAFHRLGFRMWQIAWMVVAVLALSRFALGAVMYYKGIDRLCVKSFLDCREHDKNHLTAQDVNNLAAGGITPQEYALFSIAVNFVLVFTFSVVSVLIFVQKRDNLPVGLMALSLLLFGAGFGFNGALDQEYPKLSILWYILETLSFSLLPVFFYTFPNGRIVPRYIWLFLPVWIFYFMLERFFPGINKESLGYLIFSNFVWIFMWVGIAAAQVYRYKKVSTPEERRQSKWVVGGIVVVVLLVVLFAVGLGSYDLFANKTPYTARQLVISSAFTLSVISTIPISIGIAILRSRLWDIDVIIRKTLVYTLLTGLLGLTYFGVVALLQGVVTDRGQLPPAIIVATTLAIYVLFNPLRRRIQDFIDRRFYRQKYDAEKALAGFAVVARSETNLSQLASQLTGTVQETMQPDQVGLWLQQSKGIDKM